MSEWKKFSEAIPDPGQKVWGWSPGCKPMIFEFWAHQSIGWEMWAPCKHPEVPIIKSPAELWAVSKLQAYGPEIKASYHHVKNMLIEAYNAGANERSR